MSWDARRLGWPMLAVVLALGGCSKKEGEKEAEAVSPVQVAEVQRQPIERLITAEGVLRAVDESAVVPKISAPIQKFFVNRGDHVQKGQVLAVLESRDLEAAVTDNKGGYEQAQAAYTNTASASVPEEMVKARQDVDAAKETLDAAQKVYDNRAKLFQEGALARKLVDDDAVALAQARSTYATAQEHLQAMQRVSAKETVQGAAGQLESAKGKLQAAEAQLGYAEIRSPISGKIADRPLFVGEMASAGTPIATVVDISSMIARLNVPEAQAAYLRVGQPATVAATESSVESHGKVTVVSPAVDPGTTTVEIWVQTPNPGERLLPGGAVRVTIDAGSIPDALVAPVAAVLPGESGGSAVMVVGADNVAHQHRVTIGVRTEETVQLTSGVSAGDRVVTVGGVGLTDGAKVRIEQGQP
jgi:HlyD family secretion protein